MQLLKKFKAFYNKENFDYSTGYVKPEEFHKTFFTFQRVYQVVDEPFRPWSYFMKYMITIIGMGVFTDACFSLYHAIDILDLGLIVEAATYFFMLLYKLMVLFYLRVNKGEYLHLIQAMKEDFRYICTKNEKYRAAFFETQVGTWKACLGTLFFMWCMATSLVCCGWAVLIYYLSTHPPGDRPQRPLVFPFWAPGVDHTKTPVYEFIFNFHNIGAIACTYNYTFVLQTNIVWVRHIATKAEMIGMCIKDLMNDIYPSNDVEKKRYYTGLIRFRMNEIVSHHISMYRLLDSYAKVYKKFLMFEQMISSPIICMLAYCSAEKLDAGEIPVVMMLLCLMAIIIMYVPCYLCTYLRSKLTLVMDSCWEIRFWDAGATIRPYLVLIMQRCLRPLPLQAPGFQECSIKTFSSKMTSAYSLFNMLRQADQVL